jgi:hypothetical protein
MFSRYKKTRKMCLTCRQWKTIKGNFDELKRPKKNHDNYEDECYSCKGEKEK